MSGDALVIPLDLDEVAAALGTDPLGEGAITGVSVDSRRVEPGDCFVALPGRNVDARRFIPDAFRSGAVLAVAARRGAPDGAEPVAPAERIVEVDDPVDALGTLAGLVRAKFAGPVVGITGTAGKTTVKEFLRGLTAGTLKGVFPEASFNNKEGVPRTILGLERDTGVLVVELGTNAPGEIAALCRIARPTIGILTSIGPGHLQGLKSVDGVLQEKLDLARALPAGAVLFVNGDDPILAAAAYPAGLDVRRVGLRPGPDVETPALPLETGRLGFAGDPVEIPHGLATEVQVRNLWLALNAARHLGVPVTSLAEAAPALRPARLRGETRRAGAAELLVDCYNANPLSMAAALRDLARRPGRRTAVLGEMLELGDETARHHLELGRLLARLRPHRVLFIGPSAGSVIEGAWEEGFDPTLIEGFADLEAARASFADVLAEGGTVLMKASRGMALERLLEGRP